MIGERDPEEVMGALLRKVDALEAEVQALSRGKIGHDDGRVRNTAHRVWNCEACQSMIGIYDADADEMRIRKNELYLFVVVGVGGRIRVICRQCGHTNEQKYVDPADMPKSEPVVHHRRSRAG